MDDHRSARSALEHAVVGAAVAAGELESALAHIAACGECARSFEVAETVAWLESREETHEMANVPIDAEELFERALAAALTDPDAIVRERAAVRLGAFDRLGAAVLSALVAVARDDAQARVRAAALGALDRLDAEVSFPQRVIDAWAATPAEAAAYLAGVLARLAAGDATSADDAATTGVTHLARAEVQAAGEQDVELTGDQGVRGRITHELDRVWLTVDNLPAALENTKPVVAVPTALTEGVPEIVWAGGGRGLVAAGEPVSGGSLQVLLGNAMEPATKIFDQVYLLHPREGREGV